MNVSFASQDMRTPSTIIFRARKAGEKFNNMTGVAKYGQSDVLCTQEVWCVKCS